MQRSLIGILACFVFSCGGASTSAPSQAGVASTEGRDVHDIHRARCGNCHVRVEPGTRSRAVLDDAFTRHRKRVHLSEVEWAKMADYLASDGSR